MEELRGARVLVLGLGASGQSAARFCAQRGAAVVAADERGEREVGLASSLGPGIELALGRPFPDPADFDLVVPSPGVPQQRYAARAKRVWGDIELAYRALPIPIAAITGTNGKSTTTRLVEALLLESGLRARAGGNLGLPALELVGEALDWAVLEVSSFQLEAVERFRPRVAIVLNVTQDHLDRHGTLENYARIKARLLALQGPDDIAVLSFDDARVRAMASHTRARVVPFRSAGPLERGAYFDAGAFVYREPGRAAQRAVLDAPGLRGLHHRENLVASLAAICALGLPLERALPALASFRGLAHRGEEVGRIAGVAYLDDSKATNPGAAQRALEGVPGPAIWIAGGRDKGFDFAELAETAVRYARAAVLIGETADAIEQCIAGRIPVERAASIESAVAAAARLARAGDAVLLAPACASFDQFRSYAERGDRFCKAVEALASEGGR
jgi:UDP-N-acetylmuramoylalanine--D-glutamate ligase